MPDSTAIVAPEKQATPASADRGFVEAHDEDLGKLTGALAKRDQAELRKELGAFLAKLAKDHAGPGLVALGFGAAAGPVGGLAAGYVAKWIMARFEEWLKANSADENLKKLVEETKDEAERAYLLRDIQGWLDPTLSGMIGALNLHSEGLLAVIEQNEGLDAQLNEVLSRLPEPNADTLAHVLQTRQLRLPTDPSPAQLLDARYGAVPFDEETRKDELEALKAFCDAQDAEQVEIQLVVGPGGSGKNRLAMHLREQLRERKDTYWHAGFLLQKDQDEAIEQLTRPGYPALIVIDYAESRNLGPWLKGLMDTQNGRPKLRILLLARHAGEWWETLAQGDAAVKHLCRHPVLRLQDASLDDGARQRHHGLALTAFADKLHKPVPSQSAPKLDESRYARPLYVHMAALSTLLDGSVPDAGSGARALPWEMVQRESAWWTPSADGLPWGLLRLMAAITLLGGATTSQFKRLRKDLELPADESTQDRLERYYPKGDGVGGLEPDLLGEALVTHALLHKRTDEDFLDVALLDASHDQLVQALTVLGRLAPEYPEYARGWVQRVIAVDPLTRADAAFQATVAVSERHVDDVLGQELARAIEGRTSLPLAKGWAPLLPHDTVAFRELKLWVYRQMAASAENDETAARYSSFLGIALSALGRREEALAATEQAVAIRRQLAQARPDAFLPDLAMALANMALRLEENDRADEALTAARESTSIYEPLAQRWPDAFGGYLSTVQEIVNRLSGTPNPS